MGSIGLLGRSKQAPRRAQPLAQTKALRPSRSWRPFLMTGPLGKAPLRGARRRADLKSQNASNVGFFPLDGTFVVAKLLFAPAELGGVQERAASAAAGRDHVVQDLVVDDDLHEVARNPAAVEVGVDADEPLDGAVASELDGGPRLLAAGGRARGAPPAAGGDWAPQK